MPLMRPSVMTEGVPCRTFAFGTPYFWTIPSLTLRSWQNTSQMPHLSQSMRRCELKTSLGMGIGFMEFTSQATEHSCSGPDMGLKMIIS